jgi:hypothetical protein
LPGIWGTYREYYFVQITASPGGIFLSVRALKTAAYYEWRKAHLIDMAYNLPELAKSMTRQEGKSASVTMDAGRHGSVNNSAMLPLQPEIAASKKF